MGESKKRLLSHQKIKASEERCIYCDGRPDTIDHMPPKSMFSGLHRPDGHVFAACKRCNEKTKGAEALAVLMSRLGRNNDDTFWRSRIGQNAIGTLDREVPGLRKEIFEQGGLYKWLPNSYGFLEPKIELKVKSRRVKVYLDVFSAKMAMALYREHIGSPLPLNGLVQTTWFLNGGLDQNFADKMLKILPKFETLYQGKINTKGQFYYRYNCDGKSVLAALIGFYSNFHIMTFATSDPAKFGFPMELETELSYTTNSMKPGELVDHIENSKVS